MSTMIKLTTPTARKEHICDWCGGKIEKGSKYENSSNVYEGSVFT